jgi:glycosyltransferase involved in cell wall biosynthesis
VLSALNALCSATLGATWLYHTVAARRGLAQLSDLAQPQFAVPAGTTLPRVSIIVPARNEQAGIEAAVRSLLALDYPDYELVVVNDRSEDGTLEILARLQQEAGERLKVVTVQELPAGWLGKTHAMDCAAQAATGEWLLFTDADVVHAPAALGRAVSYALSCQADHMVLFPTLLTRTVGEQMLISFFQSMFLFAHRPWKVADPKSRDFIGVGAFNLVRRAAYEQIGGYAAMRLAVVDDMRLGERLKQAGFRSVVAFGAGLVEVHWAAGAAGIVRNLTKNFFAQLHYNLPMALGSAAALLWLQLGPWLGSALAHGWTRAGYGVALTCVLMVYYGIAQRMRLAPWIVLLHPLAALLMIYALLRSTFTTLLRGGVEWRGTFYPLSELRKDRAA